MADSLPPQPPAPSGSTGDFKPNMYPIMYWALAYGVAAAILMVLLTLLSQFITIIWFPVFLAGLMWGGYRNYQKQKKSWQDTAGAPTASGSPISEFRSAVGDIASASRDLINQQAAEDAAAEEATPPAQESTPPQEPPANQPPNVPPAAPPEDDTTNQPPNVPPAPPAPPTTPPNPPTPPAPPSR